MDRARSSEEQAYSLPTSISKSAQTLPDERGTTGYSGIAGGLPRPPARLNAGVIFDTQIGPDGFMRLVRVGILLDGGDWFDGTIPRSNWPYGEAHHWTRPPDVLIILLALPLRAFLDAHAALALAGMLVSPLCHVALCIASVWIVRPLVPGPARFFAMPALLVQQGVLLYGQAGRADHHALIFLVSALALGVWIRALLDPRHSSAATLAAVLSGFGIWISPESLLPLALLFASGGAAWVLSGRRFLAINHRLCLGLAGAVAIAIALERHPSEWPEITFDRVSLAHLTMSLLALGHRLAMGFVGGLISEAGNDPSKEPMAEKVKSGWATRLMLVCGGGLVVSGLLKWIHPGFFRGPWVDVDSGIVGVWLSHVQELQPLLPGTWMDLGPFLIHLGAALFLAPLPVRWRSFGWLTAGPVTQASSTWEGDRETEAAQASCSPTEITRILASPDGLGIASLTIVTFIDDDRESLCRTPHGILAGPYHRNYQGTLAAYRFLRSDSDEQAKALAQENQIDLILFVLHWTSTTLGGRGNRPCTIDFSMVMGQPGFGEYPCHLRHLMGSSSLRSREAAVVRQAEAASNPRWSEEGDGWSSRDRTRRATGTRGNL